jgi:hypothetical protein
MNPVAVQSNTHTDHRQKGTDGAKDSLSRGMTGNIPRKIQIFNSHIHRRENILAPLRLRLAMVHG